jgi:ParB family transcriptional regulator, chromosome partitioning protein
MEVKPTNKNDDFEFFPITKNQSVIKNIEADTIEIKEIELNKLVSFDNHPFKLYEGQRFTDMVESIRANGVLVPIVVRPYAKEDEKYEILSGHNRVTAAREVGLDKVPVIIRKGLNDNEALLIVTETNLIQRSFADLKHSEKAVILTTHYNALKKKSGYRSDLLAEIEQLTCAPLGTGTRTREKIGAQYSLGKTTVARYLRVNKLIPSLKERLDSSEIGMRVAEALSYLRVKEQNIIEKLLGDGMKININQADKLKIESEKSNITLTNISEILSSGYFPEKIKPLKLSGQFLSQHFNPDQSIEEIEKIIAKALDQYFTNQNL